MNEHELSYFIYQAFGHFSFSFFFLCFYFLKPPPPLFFLSSKHSLSSKLLKNAASLNSKQVAATIKFCSTYTPSIPLFFNCVIKYLAISFPIGFYVLFRILYRPKHHLTKNNKEKKNI